MTTSLNRLILTNTVSCDACGFSTRDLSLLANHSCTIAANGGRCEDFPCCGHEEGDCNGLLYGSDDAIKEQVHQAWATGHGMCDHAEGLFECDIYDEDDDLDI